MSVSKRHNAAKSATLKMKFGPYAGKKLKRGYKRWLINDSPLSPLAKELMRDVLRDIR